MKIGPALNERNLIFGYDTGRNPSSGFDHKNRARRFFKGKTTSNVVTNTNLDTGWSKGYNTSIQTNDYPPPRGIDSQVYSFIDADGNGSGYWYSYGDYAPQDPSTTYTISLWVRTIGSDFAFRAYTANNSEVGRQSTNTITIPGDGKWHRAVFNSITTPSNTQSDSLSFQFITFPANQRVWICAPQMEVGSIATPFVDGTRSSTNSIIDLTRTTNIDVSNVSFGSDGLPTFDGTDDKMVISNFPHVWDGDVTFEAVASWNDDSRSILLGNYNVGANDINFEKLTSRKLRFYWNRGERDVSTGTNVVTTTGDYHHVVMIRDTSANNFRFYVDGTLIYTASNVGTNVTSTGSTFRVGGDTRDGTTIHNGTIPVVKVYDRVLSLQEIKANFNQYKNRFNI